MPNCKVYSGDLHPTLDRVKSIKDGDEYNLTNMSLCLHNGTHIDAPFHFIEGGNTIERIPLVKTVGYCFVCTFEGKISEDDARAIIKRANEIDSECAKRIIIKGNATITLSSAKVFRDSAWLIGVESQTVGDENDISIVHSALLEKEVVLLEGLCLDGVKDGKYLLNATPIKINGVDGAPCRAILIRE